MAAKVKMPPHNLEAEESVLGSVLIDSQALATVSGFLVPQDFYLPAHDKIYRAMRKLQGRGETIDAVTLSEELHQRGDLEKIGGVTYLTSLSERLPSATQIASHGGSGKPYSKRRTVIAFARYPASKC